MQDDPSTHLCIEFWVDDREKGWSIYIHLHFLWIDTAELRKIRGYTYIYADSCKRNEFAPGQPVIIIKIKKKMPKKYFYFLLI